MIDLFVVWTPGSVVSATVGGLLIGGLISRASNPRFDAVESAVLSFAFSALAGATFFAGQAVDTFAGKDGEVLGWRVVSRFGEWVLFSVAIAIGLALALRVASGRWRL